MILLPQASIPTHFPPLRQTLRPRVDGEHEEEATLPTSYPHPQTTP